MAEVKVYAELLAALDAADPPPRTRAEKQALVDEWREKERKLHRSKVEGDIAAAMITVEDIESALRTRHHRPSKASDVMDGWTPVEVHQAFGRLSKEIVSVIRGPVLCFGKASVQAFELGEYRSVTPWEPTGEWDQRLRFKFFPDRQGRLTANMDRERQIRCRGLLKAYGVDIGHYRLTEVSQSPKILEVDFSERLGVPRRARNAKD